MMAKVNAKRKSLKETVKEKSFQFSDVPITDVSLTEVLWYCVNITTILVLRFL